MHEYLTEWHPTDTTVVRLSRAVCGKPDCACTELKKYLLWLAPEGYDRWIAIGDIDVNEDISEEQLVEGIKRDTEDEQTLMYMGNLHRRIALAAGQPWPETPGEAVHLAQASILAIKTMPQPIMVAMLTRSDEEINEMRGHAEEGAEKFLEQFQNAAWN